jgi:hypothetical protein
MNTVELIHHDFDTSVNKLLQIIETNTIKAETLVEKEIQPNEQKNIEDSDFLNKIGFSNTQNVQKSSQILSVNKNIKTKKLSIVNNTTALSSIISLYQSEFPNYKFILLSQIYNICEKYNLYIGHSSLFNGQIPEKNINELKQFPFDKYKNNTRFHQRIILNLPLCSQFEKNYKYSSDMINYYICASYQDFLIDKNTHIIGNEIFKNLDYEKPTFKLIKPVKVPDPIILIPVNIDSIPDDMGFLINTKWGIEANDVLLKNDTLQNILDA